MWRRVSAAAWLCDFLTSSSVHLLQQSLIISFSLAGAWSLHLPPVCSARNWAAGADGGSRRAGRTREVCGRIPPEASFNLWWRIWKWAKHLDLLLHPLPSFVVPPTPPPHHHRCVLKKFVALKSERRSTRTGVFVFLFFFRPRSSDWWGGTLVSEHPTCTKLRQTMTKLQMMILPLIYSHKVTLLS